MEETIKLAESIVQEGNAFKSKLAELRKRKKSIEDGATTEQGILTPEQLSNVSNTLNETSESVTMLEIEVDKSDVATSSTANNIPQVEVVSVNSSDTSTVSTITAKSNGKKKRAKRNKKDVAKCPVEVTDDEEVTNVATEVSVVKSLNESKIVSNEELPDKDNVESNAESATSVTSEKSLEVQVDNPSTKESTPDSISNVLQDANIESSVTVSSDVQNLASSSDASSNSELSDSSEHDIFLGKYAPNTTIGSIAFKYVIKNESQVADSCKFLNNSILYNEENWNSHVTIISQAIANGLLPGMEYLKLAGCNIMQCIQGKLVKSHLIDELFIIALDDTILKMQGKIIQQTSELSKMYIDIDALKKEHEDGKIELLNTNKVLNEQNGEKTKIICDVKAELALLVTEHDKCKELMSSQDDKIKNLDKELNAAGEVISELNVRTSEYSDEIDSFKKKIHDIVGKHLKKLDVNAPLVEQFSEVMNQAKDKFVEIKKLKIVNEDLKKNKEISIAKINELQKVVDDLNAKNEDNELVIRGVKDRNVNLELSNGNLTRENGTLNANLVTLKETVKQHVTRLDMADKRNKTLESSYNRALKEKDDVIKQLTLELKKAQSDRLEILRNEASSKLSNANEESIKDQHDELQLKYVAEHQQFTAMNADFLELKKKVKLQNDVIERNAALEAMCAELKGSITQQKLKTTELELYSSELLAMLEDAESKFDHYANQFKILSDCSSCKNLHAKIATLEASIQNLTQTVQRDYNDSTADVAEKQLEEKMKALDLKKAEVYGDVAILAEQVKTYKEKEVAFLEVQEKYLKLKKNFDSEVKYITSNIYQREARANNINAYALDVCLSVAEYLRTKCGICLWSLIGFPKVPANMHEFGDHILNLNSQVPKQTSRASNSYAAVAASNTLDVKFNNVMALKAQEAHDLNQARFKKTEDNYPVLRKTEVKPNANNALIRLKREGINFSELVVNPVKYAQTLKCPMKCQDLAYEEPISIRYSEYCLYHVNDLSAYATVYCSDKRIPLHHFVSATESICGTGTHLYPFHYPKIHEHMVPKEFIALLASISDARVTKIWAPKEIKTPITQPTTFIDQSLATMPVHSSSNKFDLETIGIFHVNAKSLSLINLFTPIEYSDVSDVLKNVIEKHSPVKVDLNSLKHQFEPDCFRNEIYKDGELSQSTFLIVHDFSNDELFGDGGKIVASIVILGYESRKPMVLNVVAKFNRYQWKPTCHQSQKQRCRDGRGIALALICSNETLHHLFRIKTKSKLVVVPLLSVDTQGSYSDHSHCAFYSIVGGLQNVSFFETNILPIHNRLERMLRDFILYNAANVHAQMPPGEFIFRASGEIAACISLFEFFPGDVHQFENLHCVPVDACPDPLKEYGIVTRVKYQKLGEAMCKAISCCIKGISKNSFFFSKGSKINVILDKVKGNLFKTGCGVLCSYFDFSGHPCMVKLRACKVYLDGDLASNEFKCSYCRRIYAEEHHALICEVICHFSYESYKRSEFQSVNADKAHCSPIL